MINKPEKVFARGQKSHGLAINSTYDNIIISFERGFAYSL
jgi:hypothetical protein